MSKPNLLTKGTALAGHLEWLNATIIVGAEAANAINVAIQLKNGLGQNRSERTAVLAYLSDDANGDSVAATAPTTVAIGTDGLMMELTADKVFLLVSEADGDIDIDIGEAGTDTWYLILILPNGDLVASGAITFA